MNPNENNWDYNLGYSEAVEMLLRVIQEMKESGNFHNPTLDEVEQRMV
jgi:hypothetical protein